MHRLLSSACGLDEVGRDLLRRSSSVAAAYCCAAISRWWLLTKAASRPLQHWGVGAFAGMGTHEESPICLMQSACCGGGSNPCEDMPREDRGR